MKLTEKQQKYLEAVDWLLNNHNAYGRGDGRTTLMLYVFFRKAIQNPGNNIYIVDHFPMSEIRWDHMCRDIEVLIHDEEFKNYNIKVNMSSKSIRATQRS